MSVIDWPKQITGVIEGAPFLVSSSQSSGRGLDNRQQIVGGENSYWEINITVGKLIRENIPVFRAFIHSLKGRQNSFRFRAWNSFSLPVSGPIPDGGESYISQSAPAGSTIIDVSGYSGENIAVGGLFSINDFLHEVQSNDDGLISFLPPLRQTVSVGDAVKMSGPTVLLRLQSDTAGKMSQSGMRYASPVSFIAEEVFDR